ncbi:MAG TPA: efflux RND transporter periplasmic adaptor subunit [Candidatus Competibacteraceae bacterium]|nr:efflux RND transporter periplasmic adaptor subunit [Candidatus Competibacteraceae bacterium]MCP5133785.1 efflux RND transporter periplasmic adaptor subunit [Gammaproteobacteria bacterium]HRY19759.1 efflux RND transporter periplasmic adaptor subunit [Candidatus Competibacteraceae bacterium]
MSTSTRALPFLIYSLLAILPALLTAAELPFPVAKAQLQTLPDEYVLDGVIEAVNRSTVSAQTAGRVEEIMVDVNDFVSQGAPIVRIRNIEQRAGLEQAQASLREAQARFIEADAEYKRIRGVYEKRLVSKAQMDSATATLNAAKARLEAAEAGVAQAKESLGYTTVNAPYSGIVLERHVELGESVQPGKPLMTGFSLDELRVIVNVPQRLIGPVRRYQQARVLPLDGGTSIAAKKLTFFPYADPQSNVFKVRVYLPEKTEDLYPGMFVKTAFRVGEDQRLTVPRTALAQRGEVSAVYVIKNDQASLRQVRPGRIEGDQVEILAGLDAGETVALDPIQAGAYLKEQPNSGGPHDE